jgi:putative peptide modification system cyclase
MDTHSSPAHAAIASVGRTPQLRAVLCADLVESTALVERLGDVPAAELMRRHDRMARDLLQRHHGQEIDKSDGFLLLFGRALDAVAFALAYQHGLAGLGRELGQPLAARIGIHLGEIVLRANAPEDVAQGAKRIEVEGLAKPVAARLMGLARPGQILLSGAAFNLAQRAASELGAPGESLRWLTHGRYRFKGVPQSQLVHEVGLAGLGPLKPPPSGSKAWRDTPLWRRPAALAVEALAAVLVIGFALTVLLRPTAVIAFAERDWVVMADLQNLSQDASLDGALDTALRVGLEQSRHVNLLPALQVEDALRRMQRPGAAVDRETGIELALREGARALVLPSLSRVGERLRFNLELIDPTSGATMLVETATVAASEQLLPAVDRSLTALRASLGESLKDIEQTSAPLEDITTGNLEALRIYSEAIRTLGRRDIPTARALLEQALELDPDFAMAHAHLGLIQVAVLREVEAGHASLAHAAALADRLSTRERLAILAARHHYADSVEAADSVAAVAALYPDHAPSRHNLGLVLGFWRDQPEASLPHFEHVMRSGHPRRGESYLGAALANLKLGRLEEARRLIAAARELPSTAPMRQEGLVDLAAGDLSGVESVLAKATAGSDGGRSEFVLLRAALQLEQGDAEGAHQTLQQAVEAQAARGPGPNLVVLQLNQLALANHLGQPVEAALQAVAQSEMARLAPPEAMADRSPELHLAVLAVLAQRSGLQPLARQIVERLLPSADQRNQRAIAALLGTVDCQLRGAAQRLACLDALPQPHTIATLAAALDAAQQGGDAGEATLRRDRLLAARLPAIAEAPFLEWLLPNLLVLRQAEGSVATAPHRPDPQVR